MCGYVREYWLWRESYTRLSQPNLGILQELYMPLTLNHLSSLAMFSFLYYIQCVWCVHMNMSEIIEQLMGVGSLLPSSNSDN